jgi:ribosome-binding factor A
MKSFRPDKMGSLIRSIVSDMIANRLQDPRISQFASVTRVEVSGDLQLAKVHISVMGTDADERRTLAGLNHAKGHIQRAIAKGVTARHCPVVQFFADTSIKKAAEIIRIIDENVPQPAGDPHDEDSAADTGSDSDTDSDWDTDGDWDTDSDSDSDGVTP